MGRQYGGGLLLVFAIAFAFVSAMARCREPIVVQESQRPHWRHPPAVAAAADVRHPPTR